MTKVKTTERKKTERSKKVTKKNMHQPIRCVTMIELLPMRILREHPDNANKMSKDNFRKLRNHIKRTGRYEPIVVRPHPDEPGFYQILNGHHRFRILGELGCDEAQCIVWDVTDVEADVLLSTLNRLSGRNVPGKSIEIVQRLSKRMDVKRMTAMLPRTSKQIRALLQPKDKALDLSKAKVPVLCESLVFMVTAEQKQRIEKTLAAAAGIHLPKNPKLRAAMLVKICESYDEHQTRKEQDNG